MEPSIFQAVLSKALQAQRAAEAAKKARELVRRKSVLSKSTLPGKLADCSSTDRAISEIFLVEGDSAGVLVSDAPAHLLQHGDRNTSEPVGDSCPFGGPAACRRQCKDGKGPDVPSHTAAARENPQC